MVNEQFGESLAKEQNRLGLTQSQMAEKLGVSLATYKRVLDGGSVSLELAVKAYRITGKTPLEMVGEHTAISAIADKLRHLDERQLSIVDAVASMEAHLHQTKGKDFVTLFTPTGDMYDGMIYDAANVEKLNIKESRKVNARIDCAIKVTSNHLCPVYYKGDVLLISLEPPRNGDTGIFLNNDGRIYIRKYIQTSPCQLVPLNGFGDVIEIDDNDPSDMALWHKFGKVVAKMR